MKGRSKIVFTEDILKKVSQDKNIDIEKVRALYKIMIDFLIHLKNKTNAVSIKIPFIGTLYIKQKFVHQMCRKYSHKESDKEKLEIYKSKLDILQRFTDDLCKNERYIINRHLGKSKLYTKYYNKDMSIVELEEFQNNQK